MAKDLSGALSRLLKKGNKVAWNTAKAATEDMRERQKAEKRARRAKRLKGQDS